MRVKSAIDGVQYKKWKTPISGSQYLWLEALLQTASHTHFFFSVGFDGGRFKKRKLIFVMTIGRTWPYRLMEEEFAHSCLGKYFRDNPKGKSKVRKSPPQRTWKLWGTSFIKELDEGKALSDYTPKRDKNIFEYLIATMDEWIEFVSGPPDWTILRNMTVKAAVRRYFKEF